MKFLARAAWFAWLTVASLQAAAENESVVAAVKAADEARVAAVVAADRERLEAILSDELHYAHSNGKVDTKAVLIDTLLSGRTDYESFDYKNRTFQPAGPGIVLMHGRVIIGLNNADGRQKIDLNYLAVWRNEGGTWRFLAWQSARNQPVAPEAPKPPQPPQPPRPPGEK